MSATKPIFDNVAPWPEQNPRAVMGGNKPPLEELIPVEFRAALLAERPDFLTRFDDLVAASKRARAEDEETLGRCGDLVVAYRKCASHINTTHEAVKAPYLLGGRLVDAEKKALLARLDDAKVRVERIANTFVAQREAEQRAERERIAAIERAQAEEYAAAERERQAAAAADDIEAIVSAPVVPLAVARERIEPVRSDAGSVVSGKQAWESQVTDYTLAFMAVEDNPKVREAIDKAVAGLVRAGKRTIEGVRIWPVQKANFR
ncbi:hypothetical protein [Novosphingobium sp. FKTRR1]|uniref:hypothetical protein n=1 Tax=Novosphingobium sp. FKTRR1 TaxID=2879118 RepID=UPI001CEFE80F|nr:hypothetical protein [Novosphingobium sp. FKTRR1]